MKKSLKALILAVAMICSVLAVEPTQAAVQMPAKSATLVKRMSNYTMLKICYEPKKAWTKVTMNNKTYANALIAILPDCEGKSQFSSAKEIQKLCYKYFGKTGYKDVTTGGYFNYVDGELQAVGGDWGESYPTCKITKKKKVKDGVYDIYVTNYLKSDMDGSVTKEGESVMRIRKNTKSAFGYVVTGIKYRTTNQQTIDFYS
jgi:hypothetical protein